MRPLREASVDLAAIRHNVAIIAETVGTEHLMAVVKAAGYGHGAVEVARAALAGGADWLGVVSITEALELRAAGIEAPILAWLHDPNETFESAIAARIDLGVSSLEQLERVAAASGAGISGAITPAPMATVQLKVDTGLGRNGAVEDEWSALFAAAAGFEAAGQLRVRGIFSHLANAGDAEDAEQAKQFDHAIDLARSAGLDPQLIHLSATAGALKKSGPVTGSTVCTLVRIGLGLYGLSPFENRSAADLGLRPALELSAAIVSAKRVPAGSGVSYGYTYRTTAESTLVLVPLGYGDGIPRHASGRGPVWINGKTYPVAGRIAMDQFVVDVGNDRVAVGDRAVLFGPSASGSPAIPTADDWADAADTINYEIVTRLGARIERTYLP